MSLFRVKIKRSASVNGVRVESGMSVDIPTVGEQNPLFTNQGAAVNNAFMRIYGIDLKRAGMLSTAYLDVQKQ